MRVPAVPTCVLLAGVLCAEVVDRIAASVGRTVIAESQVRRELRLTAFLDGVEPDYSPENKRKVLDRLIDQTLIRREIDFVRFQMPPATLVKPQLEQVESRFRTKQEYRAALQKYEITEDDVVERLRWQLALLQFIEYRFQPAVQVTNSAVRQEYRRQAQAWREKHSTPPPPMEQILPELENIVRQRLTDSALDRWLGEVRTQNTILYHEGYR
jgi:hypothetical protein